jgi:hypothetical protein
MRGVILAITCGFVIIIALPAPASADGPKCNRWTRSCRITSQAGGADGGTSPDNGPSSSRKRDRKDAKEPRLEDALKKFSAALADYDRQLARYNRCVLTFDPSSNPAGCGSMPTAPTAPQFRTEAFNRPGNPPITAGQAAAVAVARLQLPTIAPGIGPSPELNPWKIAAVGYPLWLWADGTTHIGPVSDSVAGLSVSLDAKVSSLTFRMDDGHSVTCPGSGHRWTTAVEPGTKSPSCGYTYAKPSLPDRNYTVAAIANWAVTWTSNGQSGVINVPAVDTTELPVGELQVLVR